MYRNHIEEGHIDQLKPFNTMKTCRGTGVGVVDVQGHCRRRKYVTLERNDLHKKNSNRGQTKSKTYENSATSDGAKNWEM